MNLNASLGSGRDAFQRGETELKLTLRNECRMIPGMLLSISKKEEIPMTSSFKYPAVLLFVFLVGCSGGGPTQPPPSQVDNTPPYWKTVGLRDAVSGNGQITIYWGEAVDAQSPPVFYLLYMDRDSNPFDQTPVIVNTNDPYTFMGLYNGFPYWFGVRASDSAVPANVEANTVTLKQTPWDFTPDTWPPYWYDNDAITHLEPTDNSITVTLNRAHDTITNPISYQLFMDIDGDPFDQTPVYLTDVGPYTFDGLEKGREYWFGARCADGASPPNVSGNSLVESMMTLDGGWLLTWSGTSTDSPADLAIDNQNNPIYACFNLYKYDSGGNFIWERNYYEDFDFVAVDTSGNIFVTGTYKDRFIYGSGIPVSREISITPDLLNFNTDIFLMKLNPDGWR